MTPLPTSPQKKMFGVNVLASDSKKNEATTNVRKIKNSKKFFIFDENLLTCKHIIYTLQFYFIFLSSNATNNKRQRQRQQWKI